MAGRFGWTGKALQRPANQPGTPEPASPAARDARVRRAVPCGQNGKCGSRIFIFTNAGFYYRICAVHHSRPSDRFAAERKTRKGGKFILQKLVITNLMEIVIQHSSPFGIRPPPCGASCRNAQRFLPEAHISRPLPPGDASWTGEALQNRRCCPAIATVFVDS